MVPELPLPHAGRAYSLSAHDPLNIGLISLWQ